jgi:hypothetical protein
MDGLMQHRIAQLRMEGLSGDEIDGAIEKLLQSFLDLEKREEADRSSELDENVHVASGSHLIAGYGSEQRNGLHTQGVEF